MKQFLFIFSVAFATLLQAQIGFKAGLNLSNMSKKDKDVHFDQGYTNLATWHVGPTLDVALGQKTAIQTGLLWSRKGYRVPDIVNKELSVISLNYIELPLTFAYKHAVSEKMFLYAGTGLYMAMCLNATYKLKMENFKRTEPMQLGNTNSDDFQQIDLGWNTNLGVQYQHLRLNVGYLLGLKNIDPGEHVDNMQMKNRCFQLSLSYILGSKK